MLSARRCRFEFSFKVRRKGEIKELTCTLVEQVPTYRLRYLGIEVENLTDGSGAMITKVHPKSPATDARLEPGMKIVKAVTSRSKTQRQLRQQLSIAELDTPWQMAVSKEVEKGRAPVTTLDFKVSTWPNDFETQAAGKAADAPAKQNARSKTRTDARRFPKQSLGRCPEPKKPSEEKAGGEKSDGKQVPPATREEFGLLILLPEPAKWIATNCVKCGCLCCAKAGVLPWFNRATRAAGRVKRLS